VEGVEEEEEFGWGNSTHRLDEASIKIGAQEASELEGRALVEDMVGNRSVVAHRKSCILAEGEALVRMDLETYIVRIGFLDRSVQDI
jgi:hypothetical protein